MAVPEIMEPHARQILEPAHEPGELIGEAQRPVRLAISPATNQRVARLPNAKGKQGLGLLASTGGARRRHSRGGVAARCRPDFGTLKRIAVIVSSRLSTTRSVWAHLHAQAIRHPVADQVAEWLGYHASGEHQEESAEPTPEELPPLPFINMANWDNEPVPEQEWAVPDRIPLGQTSLFTGEGGYGKSTVQLHLCAAHALGRDWLKTLPDPGPSIFFEAEDGEKAIHRRLAAIATHYGVTFEDMIRGGLHVISMFGRDAVLATPTRGGKIEPTPLYRQLLQVTGDIKPKMIAIASSANVFSGSEIDRTQTQQFIGLLNRLATTAVGAVVLIAHPSLTGINTDTGLSGTTQWHNAITKAQGTTRPQYSPKKPKPNSITCAKQTSKPQCAACSKPRKSTSRITAGRRGRASPSLSRPSVLPPVLPPCYVVRVTVSPL